MLNSAPPGRTSRKRSKSNSRTWMLITCVICLGSLSIIPILISEHLDRLQQDGTFMAMERLYESARDHISPHHVVAAGRIGGGGAANQQPANPISRPDLPIKVKEPTTSTSDNAGKPASGKKRPDIALSDLEQDDGFRNKPVARGVAGLSSMESTPALVGAKRAHVECDINVDSVAYWNDPQGDRDVAFVSPFNVNTRRDNAAVGGDDDSLEPERYITFTSDRGGWNNVRMSMEIIFVIAAVTGRTLVLPPKEPLYLLHHGEEKHRGFADFFPLDGKEFQKRVKVISMEQFLKQEATGEGARLSFLDDEQRENVMNAADHCDHRAKSKSACTPIYDYLDEQGTTVNISAVHSCVIFDKTVYQGTGAIDPESEARLKKECGKERELFYWTGEKFRDPLILHFQGRIKQYRLLAHFYSMLYFTDPAVDHYYKRFVRDFLHYQDSIWCAAGKIVKALQYEARQRGFPPDENGAGGYSAMHVRRGDLQYKKVKIPSQEWYDNTKEIWKPNELIYVATDERDKSFFDDFAKHHDLRFLDDYWDFAELGKLDGNYMGMIDTIVASRGRVFAGTWFSTFSGFINRMRGYHGFSMKDSWYSFLPKKTAAHEWPIVDSSKFAYEWPDGWIAIDGDEFPTHENF